MILFMSCANQFSEKNHPSMPTRVETSLYVYAPDTGLNPFLWFIKSCVCNYHHAVMVQFVDSLLLLSLVDLP